MRRSALVSGGAAGLLVIAGAVAAPAQAVDGIVLTFGGDSFGQLGNGPAPAHFAPEAVPALAGATDVAGGREHGVAVLGGGVYAWGADDKGQVGNGGPYANMPAPVRVIDAGAVAVTTGHYHSLALLTGGTVRAWGWNNRGQTGPAGGTALKTPSPVPVALSRAATQVAGGRAHSMALLDDGSVWTWGDNGFGQLGYGTADAARHSTPQRVAGLPPIAFVAGGRDSTFAIASSADPTTGGDLYAWGNSQFGQIGNGSIGFDANGQPVKVLTPVRVLSGVVQVESGADHTVAVTADGAVYSWGRNRFGQLGYTGGSRAVPTRVTALPPTAKAFVGRDHCIAIARDGRVYTWGRNDGGQLGISPAVLPQTSTPRLIDSLSGAVDAAGGQVYTVVLR